ncbi:MAG: OadG-related small transporter subunit [Proteiniphilum sp.]|nr:OadG-related small transporter subunit [Proteiniphilum sp.]MDD4158542.1 OadG-related small transporter subunit [Proteiniphilum sp.]MDD4800497.1 OadG-related small transporter subunit [Proteiniphilum sp.]
MTPIFEKTLLIATIGMAGIFLFMAVFYLLIRALDKLMPFQEKKPAEKWSEETATEKEEEEP